MGLKRELLTSALLTGLAVCALILLGLVVKHERYFVQEPNPFILYVEIVVMIAIVGLGLYNLVGVFRILNAFTRELKKKRD